MHTIPNFVDTNRIVPGDRMTPYRRELGIGAEPVVMYAGNIGYSQSVELLLAAARALPDVMFLVNGEGVARRRRSCGAPRGLANVGSRATCRTTGCASCWRPATSTPSRCERGLARSSVPSKTYSILAAGRPVVAAIDPGTEIPALLAASGGGLAVPPDDPTRSPPPCVASSTTRPRRRRWADEGGRGSSSRRRRPRSPSRTSRWCARCAGRPPREPSESSSERTLSRGPPADGL